MDLGTIFFVLSIIIIIVMIAMQPFIRRREVNRQESIRFQIRHKDQESTFNQSTGSNDSHGRINSLSAVFSASISQRPGQKVSSQEKKILENADLAPVAGDFSRVQVEEMIERRRMTRTEKSNGFCPNCGKPTQKSDRFCPYCGREIKR